MDQNALTERKRLTEEELGAVSGGYVIRFEEGQWRVYNDNGFISYIGSSYADAVEWCQHGGQG